jgi:hypothetical protein
MATRATTEAAPSPDTPAVIHLGPPPDLAAQKKARSGSSKRQRSVGVFVRLLPEQLARLQEDAAAARMSAPGYLLAGRYGEDMAPPPRRRPPAAVPVDRKALMAALVAFNRANNNLNQTAHTGNTMMLFADEHGAERLADIGRDIVRAVEALRGDFAPVLAAILAAVQRDTEG